MRILVTGSRDWLWKQPIETALWRAYEELGDPWGYDYETTLVQGAARGPDLISAGFAAKWGWTVQPYPVTRAQWRASRGAGYARNAEMVKDGADICLAFIKHNSNGASHCLKLAKKAGIPCRVYRLPLIIPKRRVSSGLRHQRRIKV
ncbi:SLOG family protein [Streptomyces sp. NPDC006477]|uniref:SLOG family protein n=1 Tax=Streptomyces sp. NPDC006477 TaxID=3364747 RepID=UPI0036A4E482